MGNVPCRFMSKTVSGGMLQNEDRGGPDKSIEMANLSQLLLTVRMFITRRHEPKRLNVSITNNPLLSGPGVTEKETREAAFLSIIYFHEALLSMHNRCRLRDTRVWPQDSLSYSSHYTGRF